MRAIRDREPPKLPERTVDTFAVEKALDEQLAKEHPGQNLKAIIYDDAQRALEEARRRLQSNAAATAQRALPVIHELMRLAGNATWNSAAGVANFAPELVDDLVREWLSVTRDLDELRREAATYDALVKQGVEQRTTTAAIRAPKPS